MRSEKNAPRSCGYVVDERYFWQQSILDMGGDTEPGAPVETPSPRRRLMNLIERSGLASLTARIPPTDLEDEDLLRVHSAMYLEDFRELSAGRGGELGDFAGFGPGAYDIAKLAAGGAHAALAAVLRGEVDVSYALVRPPGHHAEPDRARGYCLLANTPVAIEKLRAEGLVRRVAILDWDVHHGNGAQLIYWDDPDTLTISIHQDRLYPSDSGFVDETGSVAAERSNVNIPLPAGSGRGAYEYAFEQVVEPAIERFSPELIVIASGLDSGAMDPMGRMMLSHQAFADLTRRCIALAERVCHGRLGIVQEGGYSPLYVPFCGAEILAALLGVDSDIDTDYFDDLDELPDQQLSPHQESVVNRVAQVVGLRSS
ncbi:class II histone deacetylase [Leucobacter sp. CSA1]|uniref:Class II histone deacetylase n=1 Tax=Leucobacter chromiisoli TaxID=2796471 RepID=A0A934UVY9_9MICO|nr:class II histone deacetylase [Leucobacter chromiisoli]MBK0420410.1 class II histone deacetylase [Leucobacter chromiisoli]